MQQHQKKVKEMKNVKVVCMNGYNCLHRRHLAKFIACPCNRRGILLLLVTVTFVDFFW